MSNPYPVPTAELGTCCNCGESDRVIVARADDAGAMCALCWRAEYAYVRAHLADDEIDPEYWNALWTAFAARQSS